MPASERIRSDADANSLGGGHIEHPDPAVTHVADAPSAACVTVITGSSWPGTAPATAARTETLDAVSRHQCDHAAAESAAGHPGAQRARVHRGVARSDRCAAW